MTDDPAEAVALAGTDGPDGRRDRGWPRPRQLGFVADLLSKEVQVGT